MTTEEEKTRTRRLVIIWGFLIATSIAVVLWRFTGLRFPSLELRILVVLLGTMSGVAFLYRGILLGFSRSGGWRAAATPLLWSVVGLSMAAGNLTPKINLPLTMLSAACALGGAVMTQRDREASRTS